MTQASSPWESAIRAQLLESADVKRRTADVCLSDIERAAAAIANCLLMGGRVLLCGNGGSAADCQHIAAEFTNILSRDMMRPALSAIALTTDTSFLTGNANDFGFEGIFARQVEALGRPGDVLVAISTSGNSPNVVRGVERARELGLSVVGLTGASGGRLAAGADIAIRIPSLDVQRIQEAHVAVGHVLCWLAERQLFGEQQATETRSVRTGETAQ